MTENTTDPIAGFRGLLGTVPAGLWINGKSVPSGSAELQPGIHKIVVRAPKTGKGMRMTCESGTFLPEW